MNKERIAAMLILGPAWLIDELDISIHTPENVATISEASKDVDVLRSQREGLIALVPTKAEKYHLDFYGEVLKIAATLLPLFETNDSQLELPKS
jgi:hypothetical protein